MPSDPAPTQTTGPTHTLPGLPSGWVLASIIVRRDEAWCHLGRGLLTYDALLERGDSEAMGSGPTPAAAVRNALREIDNG